MPALVQLFALVTLIVIYAIGQMIYRHRQRTKNIEDAFEDLRIELDSVSTLVLLRSVTPHDAIRHLYLVRDHPNGDTAATEI